MPITYGNIGGAEPSTVTFKAGTVSIARGSTTEQQEIIVLGDPQTSNGIARVLAAAPVSTEFGLTVRIAGGPSSVADLAVRAVLSSTSADNPVQISGNSTVIQGTSPWVTQASFPAGYISSAAQSGNSSGLTVRPVWSSSNADQPVSAAQSGSWTVRANLSSTGADNPVSVSAFPANSSLVQLNAIAAAYLSTAVQNSNSSALNVRVVGGVSSGIDFPVRANLSSTGADNPVSVSAFPANSSQIQLNAIAAGYVSTSAPAAGSSGLNVWLVGGNRVNIGSTAADNAVTATIGTNLQSSVAPSSNSSGLIVRQVIDNILTVSSTNAFASTSFTIQSSGAGLRTYVTAYSILSTNAGPSKVKFYDGSSMIWPVIFAAVSSAVSGANLAVSAPAYLFRGSAANAMTLQIASSIAGFQVAVSYFRAP